MNPTYEAIAEIIQGVRKKYPNAGAAIYEIERELAVKFMDSDPQFNASLFLSACKLPDAQEG